MSLKRKHVVFDEEQSSAPAPVVGNSTAGPSILKTPAQNGDSATAAPKAPKVHSYPAPLAGADGQEKTDSKKRYLAKKARKHRKLASAKKAAAPKNKQWQPESEEAGPSQPCAVSEAPVAEVAPASNGDASVKKKRKKEKKTKGVDEPAPAAAREVTEEEQEELDLEQRKREKRAKREARQARQREEREQVRVAEEEKAAAPEESEDSVDDEKAEASQSLSGDESDDREVDEDLDMASPIASSSRSSSPPHSPPPLVPFPLPIPAAAPSKELLARQGLPAGLADAQFVDQELRLKVAELRYKQLAKDIGLSERMKKRLAHLGIEEFFAVQTAIMPLLLSQTLQPHEGERLNDYLISAPTGSGKTLAYAVPLIEVLAPRVITRLRALIVLPTRDLVVQVRETLEMLAKGTNLVIGSISGQHSFSHEQRTIVNKTDAPLLGGSSKVDILVATPGRLVDHLKSTPNFTLQHLRFLVIDEADRLLNQSFQDWLANVISHIKPPENPIIPEHISLFDKLALPWAQAYGISPRDILRPARITCQKLLFSATLTRDPAKVAALGLRWPRYFIVQSPTNAADPTAIGAQFALPQTLAEKMAVIPASIKPLTLLYLVHGSPKIRSALVFTKSVESANRLTQLLQFFEDAWVGEKIKVHEYARDMKSGERKALLADFGAGKINILVCSDLISRGMDLPAVENVVSYDIPLDMRKYVHRVGRTARAGRAGTAWSLVEKQEALHFKAMLKTAGHDDKVKKVKVREDEIGPFRESYEIAMKRLRGLHGKTETL